MKKEIVYLGNNPPEKYVLACLIALQNETEFTIRAGASKMALAEYLIRLLRPVKVLEVERKKTENDGKTYFEILMSL